MTYVYDFTEGDKDQKDLLGGKGANLAEMTNLGLPVPPGFTITTEACRAYLEVGDVPDGLAGEIDEHLRSLEEAMGRRLGDPDDPLLVSVRSGAKVSMPGMMETVLNVGLNDESRARPGRAEPRRALRDGLLPPAAADVRRHRARHRVGGLRRGPRPAQAGPRHRVRHRPRRRATSRELVETFKQSIPSTPAATSRRTRASSSTWRPRGLRLVEHRARRPLPPPGAHPRGPRHRGQRAGDGLRQPRRRLRLRRRLHPRPGVRQPGRVRRLPAERPGRGRRRRHPQHRVAGRHGRDRQDVARRAARRSWPRSRSTTATCATSSSPSSAASSGCSRPGSASARPRRRSGSAGT